MSLSHAYLCARKRFPKPLNPDLGLSAKKTDGIVVVARHCHASPLSSRVRVHLCNNRSLSLASPRTRAPHAPVRLLGIVVCVVYSLRMGEIIATTITSS